MDLNENSITEYYTIDLLHIAKALWQRAWIILLSGLIVASAGFSVSYYVIAPQYSSSVMLYVNNSSFSLGNTSFSISSSEITAAQSLVKTYAEILNNRTTLERIIDKTEVPYTYEELSRRIEAEPSNGTEIMKVTVTTGNPYEAAKLANCVAEVLPVRISEIIDGASMEVIDSAVPNLQKVSPSITVYTALGLILGMLLASGVLAVLAVLDDTIHSEDYVLRTYDYPVLAKIPNLIYSGNKKYGYYSDEEYKART